MTEFESEGWKAGVSGPSHGVLREWVGQYRKGKVWSFVGPAFIAGTAYMDPGNFVTNIAAGSRYGSELLWVVLYANLAAMAISVLATRLGIASGCDLAENCRAHFPRWLSRCLWVAAEIAGVATDFAEVLGATVGLRLLFGWSLGAALAAVGVLCLVLADLSDRGFRALEYGMMGTVALVGGAGLFEWLLVKAPHSPWAIKTLFVPHLPAGSLWMAVGLFGATVMPHAIFLQSAAVLPRQRKTAAHARPALLRMTLMDIFVALGSASVINIVMLLTAAAIFVPAGVVPQSLSAAMVFVGRDLGPLAGLLFSVALVASGLGAAVAGTLAGNVILEGFTGVRMNGLVRRIVTFIPTAALIMVLQKPTLWLVASQAVLTLALPFAVIPLLWLNTSPKVVGPARLRGKGLAAGVVLAFVVAAISSWSLWAPGALSIP